MKNPSRRYRLDTMFLEHQLRRAGVRFDAGETAAFLRQLEDIDAQLYDVQYPELKATVLLPVNNRVSPGAAAYTYRGYDRTGGAARIANASADSPRVAVQGRELTSPIESYGASYEYTLQDMRANAMLSRPVDVALAMACREVQARTLEKVAAFGDSEVGIPGFANNSDVPLFVATNGSWSTATAEAILEDMQDFEREILSSTNSVEMPDTILLSPESYAIASTRRLPNTDVSVAEYFLRRAIGVRAIEPWAQLANANADADGPRAICYRRAPEKVELILPIEFEQLPPEVRNYAFVVNTTTRTGGTVIRYPKSVLYTDSF